MPNQPTDIAMMGIKHNPIDMTRQPTNITPMVIKNISIDMPKLPTTIADKNWTDEYQTYSQEYAKIADSIRLMGYAETADKHWADGYQTHSYSYAETADKQWTDERTKNIGLMNIKHIPKGMPRQPTTLRRWISNVNEYQTYSHGYADTADNHWADEYQTHSQGYDETADKHWADEYQTHSNGRAETADNIRMMGINYIPLDRLTQPTTLV
ncbi:hypothetical protein CHS0354_028934 [Potamilus streckersoni]|uniref:Uncharacterized protein n=1 Tax=Potamilus streckersoni TaxID=2493646 RepID=A0AAE0SJ35_9BIVA|nr:hypothetical protein CHS0354_028934 [Potamilus streckersoni]